MNRDEESRTAGGRAETREGLLAKALTVGGGVLMLLGLVAVYVAMVTPYAGVTLFGALLATGGVLQLGQAYMARRADPFTSLLTGVVAMFAGVFLIARSHAEATALTLMLAGFFVGLGCWRTTIAFMARDLTARGWTVFSGVVTLLLGLSIGMQWPANASWAIGVVVGVDLLATGVAQLVAGLAIARAEKESPGALPGPAAA